MNVITCPRCESRYDATAFEPGSMFKCANCGNTVAAVVELPDSPEESPAPRRAPVRRMPARRATRYDSQPRTPQPHAPTLPPVLPYLVAGGSVLVLIVVVAILMDSRSSSDDALTPDQVMGVWRVVRENGQDRTGKGNVYWLIGSEKFLASVAWREELATEEHTYVKVYYREFTYRVGSEYFLIRARGFGREIQYGPVHEDRYGLTLEAHGDAAAAGLPDEVTLQRLTPGETRDAFGGLTFGDKAYPGSHPDALIPWLSD